MAVTIVSLPDRFALTKGGRMFFHFTGSSRTVTSGTKAENLFIGNGQAIPEGSVVTLRWNGKIVTLTARVTPKEPNEFLAGNGSKAYFDSLVAFFSTYYPFRQDFTVTRASDTKTQSIVLTARQPGPAYNISATGTTSVTVFTSVLGVTPTLRERYSVFVELYAQKAGTTGTNKITDFERIFSTPIETDDNGECSFDAGAVLHDQMGVDWPNFVTSGFSFATHSQRAYYITYAEAYGNPLTPGTVQETAIQMALYGGADYFSRSVDGFSLLGLVETTAGATDRSLRFGSRTRYVRTDEPQFLTFLNTRTDRTGVSLRCLLTFDDNSQVLLYSMLPAVNWPTGQKITFPAGVQQLALASRIPTGRYLREYTVQLYTGNASKNTLESGLYRFIIDYQYRPYVQYFAFLNSLGAVDTLTTYGKGSAELSLFSQQAERYLPQAYDPKDGQYITYDVTLQQQIDVATGFRSAAELARWNDFYRSASRLRIKGTRFVPISITSKSIKQAKDGDSLFAHTFQYVYMFQDEFFTGEVQAEEFGDGTPPPGFLPAGTVTIEQPNIVQSVDNTISNAVRDLTPADVQGMKSAAVRPNPESLGYLNQDTADGRYVKATDLPAVIADAKGSDLTIDTTSTGKLYLNHPDDITAGDTTAPNALKVAVVSTADNQVKLMPLSDLPGAGTGTGIKGDKGDTGSVGPAGPAGPAGTPVDVTTETLDAVAKRGNSTQVALKSEKEIVGAQLIAHNPSLVNSALKWVTGWNESTHEEERMAFADFKTQLLSNADTKPKAPNDSSLAAQQGTPLVFQLGAFTDPATGNPVARHELLGMPAGMSFDGTTRSGSTGTAVAGQYALTYQGTNATGESTQIPIALTIYPKPVSIHIDEVYINPLPTYSQLGLLVRGSFGSYVGEWTIQSLSGPGSTVTATFTATQARQLVSDGGPFAIPAPYQGSAPYGGLASDSFSGWYRVTLKLPGSGLTPIVMDFDYGAGVQKAYPELLPNILVGKPAKQSSTFTDPFGSIYSADLAVDNNANTWCHTSGTQGAGQDCWQADARQNGVAPSLTTLFVQRRVIEGETPEQAADLKARLAGTYLITGTNLPDPIEGSIDAIINLPGVKYVLIKASDLDELGNFTTPWDGGNYTHVRMQRSDKSPINFAEIGARGRYPSVNRPPVVQTIPAQSTVMGQTASIDLNQYVTDADGDAVSFVVRTDGFSGTGGLTPGVSVAGSVITCTLANQASAVTVNFFVVASDGKNGVTQFQFSWNFTPATTTLPPNQVQSVLFRFIAGGTPGNLKDQLILVMNDTYPVETTATSSLALNRLLRAAGSAETFSYLGFPRSSSDNQRAVTYTGGKAGGGDIGNKSWIFSVRQGAADGSAQSTWTKIIEITLTVPAASTDGFITLYTATPTPVSATADVAFLSTTETFTF